MTSELLKEELEDMSNSVGQVTTQSRDGNKLRGLREFELLSFFGTFSLRL